MHLTRIYNSPWILSKMASCTFSIFLSTPTVIQTSIRNRRTLVNTPILTVIHLGVTKYLGPMPSTIGRVAFVQTTLCFRRKSYESARFYHGMASLLRRRKIDLLICVTRPGHHFHYRVNAFYSDNCGSNHFISRFHPKN